MMHIFWRVIFGFGALVFGLMAAGVGSLVWQLRADFPPKPFENWGADSVFLIGDGGGASIRLSTAQFLGGVVAILLVAGSLSLSCAYFAFRSEKAEAPDSASS